MQNSSAVGEHRSTPSAARRGFTLIEVMVGMVIGLLLTTAAVAFVRSESRLMGVTEDRLDMVQASRTVMNLLTSDIRVAGLGLRPRGGDFQGLLTGQFPVGGVSFGVAGNTVQLEQADANTLSDVTQYNVPTQDLGLRLADGDQATIVEFTGKGSSAGTMTVCDHPGMDLRSNEIVLLQDQPSLSNWSVELTNVGTPSVCASDCANGCVPLSWQEPTSDGRKYEANAGSVQDYGLGQMFSQFKTIVWFMTPDPNRPDRGVLRRMTYDDTTPDCGARDNNCGVLVARNVEAFYYRVYQFTPATGWAEVLPGSAPTEDARVRIDIELVFRAEEAADKSYPQVQALLSAGGPTPFPPAARDRIERRVYRATVELRNAGRI